MGVREYGSVGVTPILPYSHTIYLVRLSTSETLLPGTFISTQAQRIGDTSIVINLKVAH